MSKICPKCESNNIHLAATVPHALCVCFDCRHQWKNKYKPRKKTFFHKITASPEVLAEKLLYYLPGVGWYFSTLFDGDTCWKTKAEAIAATVEKLNEVSNG